MGCAGGDGAQDLTGSHVRCCKEFLFRPSILDGDLCFVLATEHVRRLRCRGGMLRLVAKTPRPGGKLYMDKVETAARCGSSRRYPQSLSAVSMLASSTMSERDVVKDDRQPAGNNKDSLGLRAAWWEGRWDLGEFALLSSLSRSRTNGPWVLCRETRKGKEKKKKKSQHGLESRLPLLP